MGRYPDQILPPQPEIVQQLTHNAIRAEATRRGNNLRRYNINGCYRPCPTKEFHIFKEWPVRKPTQRGEEFAADHHTLIAITGEQRVKPHEPSDQRQQAVVVVERKPKFRNLHVWIGKYVCKERECLYR